MADINNMSIQLENIHFETAAENVHFQNVKAEFTGEICKVAEILAENIEICVIIDEYFGECTELRLKIRKTAWGHFFINIHVCDYLHIGSNAFRVCEESLTELYDFINFIADEMISRQSTFKITLQEL